MCSIELLAAGSKKACCEEGERDVKKARRQRPGQTTPQDISIVVTRHRQQQCIILPHRLLMMLVGHLFAPHDGRLSLQTDQIHQTLIIWFLSHVAFRRFCGEKFQNNSRGPMNDPENVPMQAFSTGMGPRASPTPIFDAPVRGRDRETARESAGDGSIHRRARARKKPARSDHYPVEHLKNRPNAAISEGSAPRKDRIYVYIYPCSYRVSLLTDRAIWWWWSPQ